MSPQLVGLLGISALLLLIFLRVPVAVSLGVVGFLGYAAISSWNRALLVLGSTPFDLASSYALSVVPLFTLMGALAAETGMSTKLFVGTKALFNGLRGAEALATVGACAGFGAVCGSSLATAATMSRIAVPEMRAFGYDDRLSTGVVAAGGALGILIPPSVIFVVYAIISEQSLGKLFAAGLIPGLLLAALDALVVILLLLWRPGWASKDAASPWRKRLRDVLRVWEVAALFMASIGGMYAGWFSPTEAAAVGALGALLIGVTSRQLTLQKFETCIIEAVSTTAMLFLVIIGAFIFSYFIVLTNLPRALVDIVIGLHLSPVGLMIGLVVIYIILGCFLDGMGMILVTVPLFLPLVTKSGFDPIWFGVILVVVVEVGLIHPPMGMNIFVIRAQMPDIPLKALYVGIVPFLLAHIVLIVLLFLFPKLALWLPTALYG